MTRKVVIIGGGIAGLTAAHELAKARRAAPGLDFEVHVHEAEGELGGKARSQFFGPDRRLPGEHGFRFFPHFYRHITQTLREIPCPDPASTDGHVSGLLRESAMAAIVYEGAPRPFHRAEPYRNILEVLRGAFDGLDANLPEVARYSNELLRFASSCDDRRLGEYERISWEDYLELDSYSDHFERLLRSVPSNLSAMKAEHGSARTIGNTSLQVLWDFDPGHDHLMDAVLAGPTERSFLRHFRAHLDALGVTFHLGKRALAFDYDGAARRIERVRFTDGTTDEGAHYILAVPIEQAVRLIDQTPAMRHDVSLDNLVRLWNLRPSTVAPMVGVQFVLDRDIPVIHGHMTFPYAEWALTAVSQQQFWSERLSDMTGDEAVEGVISAIISEWNVPGINGKTAGECETPDELLDEVWRQLKRELPGVLKDSYVLARHLDSTVRFEGGPPIVDTPLLIHPVGSHELRPHARTTIGNLLLAADYVRTLTDLASMEGADEAARTAVAAILREEGAPRSAWPAITPPTEGFVFAAAKAVDQQLYDLGLPHPMSLAPLERLSLLPRLAEVAGDRGALAGPAVTPDLVRRMNEADGPPREAPESVERWEELLLDPR